MSKTLTRSGVMAAEPMKQDGLVGFFGHTFTTDEQGERVLQYQFRIVRALPPDRWAVQLYSFSDGEPNHLAFYTEAYLLGDEVNLYPDNETWNAAYEKYSERQRWRRER